MNHLDDMFKLAMAIDADNIADITSGKASFAEYPDEKPSKVKLIAWLDSWHDDLVGLGYGASLRGEAPYQLAKLRPRPLIVIPADAEASKKLALETENARICRAQALNAQTGEDCASKAKMGMARTTWCMRSPSSR